MDRHQSKIKKKKNSHHFLSIFYIILFSKIIIFSHKFLIFHLIILFQVDRSKINSVGFPALKKFLLKMMVYKSTADLENAQLMFEGYAKVDESFIELRNIVVENKQPRRLELQGHLKLVHGEVIYQEFEENIEGIIASFLERFEGFDKEVLDLWREYKEYY